MAISRTVVRTAGTAAAAAGCSLALLAAAGPVSAASTTNSTREVVALSQDPVTTCAGGEVITLGFDVVRNRHFRYDRTGELASEVRNVNFTGTFVNTATGDTVTFQGTRVITFDYAAGTFFSRGNARTVTMPGEGTVFHAAGQYLEDLEVEGLLHRSSGPRQDELAEGGAAAACSLFGLSA